MRLSKARVCKYRSIHDTGWFDVESTKTILVGPNEAGKTALLKALQQLNAQRGYEVLILFAITPVLNTTTSLLGRLFLRR